MAEKKKWRFELTFATSMAICAFIWGGYRLVNMKPPGYNEYKSNIASVHGYDMVEEYNKEKKCWRKK